MTTNRSIINRFFEALDLLKSQGEITGISDFCQRYGFNRVRYTNVKNHPNHPDYKTIDIEAIYYLVKDFNFSADWILTGQGVERKQSVQTAQKLHTFV